MTETLVLEDPAEECARRLAAARVPASLFALHVRAITYLVPTPASLSRAG